MSEEKLNCLDCKHHIWKMRREYQSNGCSWCSLVEQWTRPRGLPVYEVVNPPEEPPYFCPLKKLGTTKNNEWSRDHYFEENIVTPYSSSGDVDKHEREHFRYRLCE